MEPIPTMDNRLTVAFLIRDSKDTVEAIAIIKAAITNRIDAVKAQITESLAEQNSKITSDNIFKEGFNKTVLILTCY